MKSKNVMVPISERALFARVSRALAKEKMHLRRAREGTRTHSTLGDYYILDDRNTVADSRVNLTAMAKKLGCLAAFEQLVD